MAERSVQRLFSKWLIFSSLALALPIFALAAWSKAQPNRVAMPDAVVEGRAEGVPLTGTDLPGMSIRAWRLSAPDRRFGGLSALAIDGGKLVALTDSGVVVRFAPPKRSDEKLTFHFHDLPDGPGDARRKAWRDSESIIADPAGRGWWVGFETRHSMWLFDRRFSQALDRHFLDTGWSRNGGAEALVADHQGAILALPEHGGWAVGLGRTTFVVPRGIADATRLGDGRLVLLVRRFGLSGFESEVRIAPGGGKARLTLRLPLGPLDNAEAVAAAPLASGGTRLWIMTDDNFRPWMRTLLVALDLPPGA